MREKNLILIISLAILIMVNFVSAQVRDVECASDYDCRLTNEVCNTNTWECVSANVNLQGEVYNGQNIEISEDKFQNNSIGSALVIALGIIIGLIVLGLLIRRRNK